MIFFPENRLSICMKHQSLFSGNKKNISKLPYCSHFALIMPLYYHCLLLAFCTTAGMNKIDYFH